ncbi:MAG: Si-specific NAD(P)(+) transhydrogenase [Elusimicrobia bacterium]|nr:Si-specific NAD(P)(+) transhydrogenase [Elusimicrobiota bacterium]
MPTADQRFDVVVIGSGPGGEGAAMKAAKSGRSVAVIEEQPEVGGGCTHWTTIPSKVLREAVWRLTEFSGLPRFREAAAKVELSYADLVRDAGSVIEKQVRMRRGFYDRNGVTVLTGRARFVARGAVEVADRAGATRLVEGAAFVVATGSRPYHPPEVDFSHPRVLDSHTVLRLKETPRSLIIYGAGVAGCEYASIFRGLGSKVSLVNTRGKLLSFLDDEISGALTYHLRDQGVVIRHDEEFARVEADDAGVRLHLKSGKTLAGEFLLWANGRTGNTDGIGLEALGVGLDGRGCVKVDGDYRSSVPGLYAVGDAVGNPPLASAAYDQGRCAAARIVGERCDRRFSRFIPTGIYTIPEISSVGETEAELTRRKVPYEVGQSFFRDLSRAQIAGWPMGMLKLLFHRDTLAVLGVHCFGYQASEIVHIGQLVLSQEGEGSSVLRFADTTFNYPTMAEAYRVAALNGLNRLKGVYPSRRMPGPLP